MNSETQGMIRQTFIIFIHLCTIALQNADINSRHTNMLYTLLSYMYR